MTISRKLNSYFFFPKEWLIVVAMLIVVAYVRVVQFPSKIFYSSNTCIQAENELPVRLSQLFVYERKKVPKGCPPVQSDVELVLCKIREDNLLWCLDPPLAPLMPELVLFQTAPFFAESAFYKDRYCNSKLEEFKTYAKNGLFGSSSGQGGLIKGFVATATYQMCMTASILMSPEETNIRMPFSPLPFDKLNSNETTPVMQFFLTRIVLLYTDPSSSPYLWSLSRDDVLNLTKKAKRNIQRLSSHYPYYVQHCVRNLESIVDMYDINMEGHYSMIGASTVESNHSGVAMPSDNSKSAIEHNIGTTEKLVYEQPEALSNNSNYDEAVKEYFRVVAPSHSHRDTTPSDWNSLIDRLNSAKSNLNEKANGLEIVNKLFAWCLFVVSFFVCGYIRKVTNGKQQVKQKFYLRRRELEKKLNNPLLRHTLVEHAPHAERENTLAEMDEKLAAWDTEAMTLQELFRKIWLLRLFLIGMFLSLNVFAIFSPCHIPSFIEGIMVPLVLLATSYAISFTDTNHDCAKGFPKAGLRFSYIVNEFIGECGGVEALKDMTTAQVCEDIIKAKTQHTRSSYCDKLAQEGHAAYGEQAKVFISHAHSYLFLDTLSALEWHLRDEPNTVIWFDLFSINQHQTTNWSFDWLSTTFKSAIGQFGRVIMIMSPWNNPLPFTRAWCVFEAYCAAATDAEFEIAMSCADESQFLEDVKAHPDDSVDEMLAAIRAEKSQCTVEEDRIRIFSVIRKTVGFSRLDSMVLDRCREWMIALSS